MRLPVRESLDELWAKKEREYAGVRAQYTGLFDVDGQRFIAENQALLIDRPFEVGRLLVDRWETAPDLPNSWAARFLRNFPPSVVEVFRQVPGQLADSGQAVTWATISRRLDVLTKRHPRYRQLVQHIYFGIYVDLMSLRTLANIPTYLSNFGISTDDLFYDYSALETVADSVQSWQMLLHLSSQNMLSLRASPPYFDFRRSYRALCDLCTTHYSLREATALPVAERSKLLERTEAATRLSKPQLVLIHSGQDDSDDEAVEALGTRLSLAAARAVDRTQAAGGAAMQRRVRVRSLMEQAKSKALEGKSMTQPGRSGARRSVRLGIFAPLGEEREVLRRKLDLRPVSGANYRWTGTVGPDTELLLYSASLMGRVPAAVMTATLLNEDLDLDAIVITGFAGGFQETGTELGQVLVPATVADLALRKIQSADNNADAQVRPRPFDLDGRLQAYLDTHFDKRSWASRTAEEAEWPAGRHPQLLTGNALVCGDEVVASAEHRAALLRAWPQARGVEMESGGVVAAVRAIASSLPVFHVRVVTDMADPAKTDTAWRGVGAKTLATFIQDVNWPSVLAESNRK